MSSSRTPNYTAWLALAEPAEDVCYLPTDRRDVCWFQPSPPTPRFPVLQSALDRYNTTAMYSSPPQKLPKPLRFALIGRMPIRAFNLDADANCERSRFMHSRSEGEGSAELEDLEPLNAESDFKKGWNRLATIASAALPAFKEFDQAHGVFSVHNGLPTLELRHNFFRVCQCFPFPCFLIQTTC